MPDVPYRRSTLAAPAPRVVHVRPSTHIRACVRVFRRPSQHSARARAPARPRGSAIRRYAFLSSPRSAPPPRRATPPANPLLARSYARSPSRTSPRAVRACALWIRGLSGSPVQVSYFVSAVTTALFQPYSCLAPSARHALRAARAIFCSSAAREVDPGRRSGDSSTPGMRAPLPNMRHAASRSARTHIARARAAYLNQETGVISIFDACTRAHRTTPSGVHFFFFLDPVHCPSRPRLMAGIKCMDCLHGEGRDIELRNGGVHLHGSHAASKPVPLPRARRGNETAFKGRAALNFLVA
ncbi:hypothetical protein BD309DRAFT_313390 [Dichomitus squalens]|nr:hypothetical protein BD309DRAFT_313390 [Dichomitus squalens]